MGKDLWFWLFSDLFEVWYACGIVHISSSQLFCIWNIQNIVSLANCVVPTVTTILSKFWFLSVLQMMSVVCADLWSCSRPKGLSGSRSSWQKRWNKIVQYHIGFTCELITHHQVIITSISAVMVLPRAFRPNIPTFMTTTFDICQRSAAPMGELVECCCCDWMDMSTQCFACCIENMKEILMILQNAFLPCGYNAKCRHWRRTKLGL